MSFLKPRKIIVKVVRLRPYDAIDQNTKARIIKDFKGGKSKSALALQSGLSYYLIDMILKKNEMKKAAEGSPTRCSGLFSLLTF